MKMQYVSSTMTPLDANGAIQTNPVLVPLALTENSMTAKSAKEERKVLGNCCGGKVSFGAKEVSGSMGGVLTPTLALIMFQHVFGKADSVENATTDTWAASTVTGKRELVNHSNGTDTLVSIKAGTTGTTEPTVTDYLKRTTDASVKWIAQPLFKKSSITTNKKPRAMAIENKFKQEDGTFVYVRYIGLVVNSTPLEAKNSEVAMKWKVDAIGATSEDSIMTEGYVALADMPNAKTIKMIDDVMEYDEENGGYALFKDGVAVEEFESISYTFSREVTKSSCIAKQNADGSFEAHLPNVGTDISSTGQLMLPATAENYQMAQEHEPFESKLSLIGYFGGEINITQKGVVPGDSDISIEDCMDSKLDIDLTVTGSCDGTEAPVTIEIIHPQLTDTTGAVVTYPI